MIEKKKPQKPASKTIIPKRKQPLTRSSPYSGTPGGSTPIPTPLPTFN